MTKRGHHGWLVVAILALSAHMTKAVVCSTETMGGVTEAHPDKGDVDSCVCGLFSTSECPSPGRKFDPSQSLTPCPNDVCSESLCCKPTKCADSGNNHGPHVCEDSDLVYDRSKDEIECPLDGCSDKVCCQEGVKQSHSAGDQEHVELTLLQKILTIAAFVVLVPVCLCLWYCVCCRSLVPEDDEDADHDEKEFDSEQDDDDAGTGIKHAAAAVHDQEDKVEEEEDRLEVGMEVTLAPDSRV